MVRRALTAALAAAALVGSALGQKCSKDSHCPKEAPCCGLYGDCGAGAFCLGGCDPLMSNTFESCVPAPSCREGTYELKSLDDIQTIDKYLGDSSKINWQSQGKPVVYQDSILLTMAEGTVGTLLASTHYVWYGKTCAKMTTSQGKGVVTAFILMSDVKDEIDFEWVGTDVSNVQSNYYSQGVTVYTNSKNLTVGNSVEEVHEYCMDWTEDELTWLVDGKEERKMKRSDTWNSTSNRFDYPQTPSRIMLSLWPAGLPSNAKGTIDWAGGEIDWNSPYMQNGYYYAMVKEVSVKCYDPPPMAKGSGSKSYKYTDEAGTNNTVELSNDIVILASLTNSGDDPGDKDASSTSTGPAPTRSVALVPGGNPGGGGRQESAVQSGAAASATPGADSPQATGGSGGGSSNDGTGSGAFSQGGGNDTGSGASLERFGGSALAIVVAVIGLLVL